MAIDTEKFKEHDPHDPADVLTLALAGKWGEWAADGRWPSRGMQYEQTRELAEACVAALRESNLVRNEN